MAVSHQPIFVQTPKQGIASFVNADGTTKKTIATAGTNGTKVTAVTAASTDSATRVVTLWLTRSAVSYALTAASLAITSGTDGTTPGTNLMGSTLWPGLSVDGSGQRYLLLQSGDTLQASMVTAVTAAKEIDVTATYADY